MSPITGSGNEKPVYDVFTSPPFQNVSKLQKFVLNVLVQASRGLSLGCVLLKSSANTQRLGCSDRILKAIAMWYKYNLFDGLTCGYFASCVVFFPSSAGARKNASNEQKNCYFAIGFYVLVRYLEKSLFRP